MRRENAGGCDVVGVWPCSTDEIRPASPDDVIEAMDTSGSKASLDTGLSSVGLVELRLAEEQEDTSERRSSSSNSIGVGASLLLGRLSRLLDTPPVPGQPYALTGTECRRLSMPIVGTVNSDTRRSSSLPTPLVLLTWWKILHPLGKKLKSLVLTFKEIRKLYSGRRWTPEESALNQLTFQEYIYYRKKVQACGLVTLSDQIKQTKWK